MSDPFGDPFASPEEGDSSGGLDDLFDSVAPSAKTPKGNDSSLFDTVGSGGDALFAKEPEPVAGEPEPVAGGGIGSERNSVAEEPAPEEPTEPEVEAEAKEEKTRSLVDMAQARERAADAGSKDKFEDGEHDFIFPNGNLYSGEWKDQTIHGEGSMEYAKDPGPGNFEGKFEKGKRKKGCMRYLESHKTYPGAVYKGEFENEKFHGTGTMEDENGVYIGGWVKGKMHKQGEMKYSESNSENYVVYTGNMEYGKLHGKGELQYRETEEEGAPKKFEGNFIKGLRVKGKLDYCNGDIFDGDFTKNNINQGTMYYTDGDKYAGSFKGGQKSGKGEYTFAEQESTVGGEFQKDKVTKGTMKYKDGGVYSGTFSKEEFATRHGKGIFEFANGDKFTGSYDNGCMVKGEMTYDNGDVYTGIFDKKGNKSGTGILVWKDGKKFEGEYEDDLMTQGTLTEANGNKYEGLFDASGEKDGAGVFVFKDKEWEGKHDAGKPLPEHSTVEYQEKYPDDADGPLGQTRTRKTYEGALDSDYEPHGEGKLTWSNGDVYEGNFENNTIQGPGKFTDNTTKNRYEGEFERGALSNGQLFFHEHATYLSYEGEFSPAGQMEGQGQLTLKEGGTYTGTFADDGVFTEGTYVHQCGNSFQGTFNAEGREMVTGKVVFKDGTEYIHNADDSSSFLFKVNSLLEEASAASTAVNTEAETTLSALSIWPNLDPLTGSSRLSETLANALTKVQEQNGVKALEELQTKRSGMLVDVEKAQEAIKIALENEIERDANRRERFEELWTLEKSDQFNSDFLKRSEENKACLGETVEADKKLKEDQKACEEDLSCLTKTGEDYEEDIADALEKSPARVALVALLTAQVALIAKRTVTLDGLETEAAILDVLPMLMDGSATVEEAFEKELGKVQSALDEIKVSADEHKALLIGIAAAYATYNSTLAGVESGIVDPIKQQIEQGVAAFDRLFAALEEACGELICDKNDKVLPLKSEVDTYCTKRFQERKDLSMSLLLVELHAAVEERAVGKIEELVAGTGEDKVDVNKHSNGKHAIHLAVLQGSPEIIKLLSDSGGLVTTRDTENHTLLWVAIEQKQLECIPVLVEAGADPNIPEEEKTGLTPLHILAKANNTKMCQLLLEHSGSVSTVCKQGRTALAHACDAGAAETITLLLTYGSPLNLKDNDGNTPLHLTKDTAIIKSLVENGARTNMKNNKKELCVASSVASSFKDASKKFKKLPAPSMDAPPLEKGDIRWIPDEKATSCMSCGIAWSMFNRRHHCRRCGSVVCTACHGQKATDKDSPKKAYKVCDGCFNLLYFMSL